MTTQDNRRGQDRSQGEARTSVPLAHREAQSEAQTETQPEAHCEAERACVWRDDAYSPRNWIRVILAFTCCIALGLGIAACTVNPTPATSTTPDVSITASPTPTPTTPTPTQVPTRAANGTGGYLAGLIDWADITETTEPLHFMNLSDGAIDLGQLGRDGHVTAVHGIPVSAAAGATFDDVLAGTGAWASGLDGTDDTVAVDGMTVDVSLPATDETPATDYASVFAAKNYSMQTQTRAGSGLDDVMRALGIDEYDVTTPDGPMRAIAARYGRPSIGEAAYSGSLMTYWWTREGYSFGIRTYELSEMGCVEYLSFVYAPDPLDASPLTKQFASLVSGAQSQGLKSFNEFLES